MTRQVESSLNYLPIFYRTENYIFAPTSMNRVIALLESLRSEIVIASFLRFGALYR